MRWGPGMVWGVQWSRFQRLRTGITWLPVLRAASQSLWAGVRKPLPRACDSAAHPTVTQINSVTAKSTADAKPRLTFLT
jgi:hypothetical protein